jgi:putative transcriptional regulator
MRDPRFHETVIYMVSHDASGAVGLVVNRPLAHVPLKELLKGFGVERDDATGEIVAHYGGPVSPRQGFVLHSDEFLLDTSIVVKDGIVMTPDIKLLQAIADGKGPRQSLLAFGYAGWAPGQLEGEILANSWFTIPADSSLIFGKDASQKWRRAMDRRKIEL